jgi:hypothetical protein
VSWIAGWCPASTSRLKRECGAGLAQFRDCPRNCERRATPKETTGPTGPGRFGEAVTRKSGDLPSPVHAFMRRSHLEPGRGALGAERRQMPFLRVLLLHRCRRHTPLCAEGAMLLERTIIQLDTGPMPRDEARQMGAAWLYAMDCRTPRQRRLPSCGAASLRPGRALHGAFPGHRGILRTPADFARGAAQASAARDAAPAEARGAQARRSSRLPQ